MHDGLGYLDTSLVNIAMGEKLYWKLKTKPDLWWPQVLHAKYLQANDNHSTNGTVSQGSLI